MAKAADAAGLRELAITDHWDFPGSFDAAGYRAAVLEARAALGDGGVYLVCGAELGEATHDPDSALAVVRNNPFDFILGSYHKIKGVEDFFYLRYDTPEKFHALAERYLDELLELIGLGCFDVLGHLTYPIRYVSREPALAGVSFKPHQEQMRAVLKSLIDAGKGLELNVKGLRQKPEPGPTMPELEWLKLYRSLGGEIVTVGSDAHQIKSVGRGIAEGQAMLREAGFRYVAAYRERNVRFEKLS